MKQPSEREIILLQRMRAMNFVERIESIGSIVPGDDVLELMEWRFLRDDLLPIIKELKCSSLSELQKKYPIDSPRHVTVSPATKQRLIERYGLTENDFLPGNEE